MAWVAGFDSKEFYFSYLTSFFFWLSIILGAMFFVFVHYAFSATWSVAIIRVMENTLMLMPIFTMLFFPIIAGMELLFKWLPNHSYWLTHSFEADHLIQHKLPFLNKEFFLQRAVAYFSLWNLIAFYIYYTSTNHDVTGDHNALKKLKNFTMSPIGAVSYTHLRAHET